MLIEVKTKRGETAYIAFQHIRAIFEHDVGAGADVVYGDGDDAYIQVDGASLKRLLKNEGYVHKE